MILCVLLSHTYLFISRSFDLDLWFSAALIHSLLSLLVICCFSVKKFNPYFIQKKTQFFSERTLIAFLPALTVLFFTLILQVFAPDGASAKGPIVLEIPYVASILWIPAIEELVFRVGIGSALKGFGGRYIGSYFSILVFTSMHSLPSLQRILAGEVGMAWGAFLLAIVCELVYSYSGRIMPAIAFHMVCNSTVLVFNSGSRYWLGYFSFLYH